MNKIIKTALLSIIFGLSIPMQAYAMNAIGKATDITGTVMVERAGQSATQELQIDDPIFLHDTILTDEGDYAEIEFIDETLIAISDAQGRLSIDEYVYDPEKPEENKARFNILRSSFKYVSGLVGKENHDVKIGLDFGSIGIRGTTIYRAMRDGECWIYLEDGKIQVKNKAGFVTLNPNDGTRMRSNKIAPLPAKPWAQKNIDWIKAEVAKPE